MHRFAIVCGTLLLLGATAAALAADASFDPNGKIVPDKSTLTKHGLAEFDLDGNGTLSASERALAAAARRGGRAAPSAASDNQYSRSNGNRYYSSSSHAPYSTASVNQYATQAGYAPCSSSNRSLNSNPNDSQWTSPTGIRYSTRKGYDYSTPNGYSYNTSVNQVVNFRCLIQYSQARINRTGDMQMLYSSPWFPLNPWYVAPD